MEQLVVVENILYYNFQDRNVVEKCDIFVRKINRISQGHNVQYLDIFVSTNLNSVDNCGYRPAGSLEGKFMTLKFASLERNGIHHFILFLESTVKKLHVVSVYENYLRKKD